MNRLTLLLSNVVLDHLVCLIPGTDGKVSPRPQMTPPDRLPQMRKLLKDYSRTGPFQSLIMLTSTCGRYARNT